MSFICDVCKISTPDRVKPTKTVVATRNVQYVQKDTGKVSHGEEIVREIFVCPGCVSS